MSRVLPSPPLSPASRSLVGGAPHQGLGAANAAPLPPDATAAMAARTLWSALVSPLSGEAPAHSVLCLFFIAAIVALELPVPCPRHPLNLLHMYTDAAASTSVLYALLLSVIASAPVPRYERQKRSGAPFWRRGQRKVFFVLSVLIATTALECIGREVEGPTAGGDGEGRWSVASAETTRAVIAALTPFSPSAAAAAAYAVAIIAGLIGF